MPAPENTLNRKRPIHVAFFTGYIPPYQTPVYRALAEGVQRLSVLVSTPMEHDREWEVQWDGLDVEVQKAWSRKRYSGSTRSYSEPGALHFPVDTWRRIAQLQPDVVISEELGFRSLACVARRIAVKKLPLILVCNLSEHTERDRGGLRRMLRRVLLRNSSSVTVNGNSGERYLRSLGVAQDKIFRFPYAAVSEPFLKVKLERESSQAYRLVCCGSLSERKGTMPMLAALAAWCTRNPSRAVELSLIGDGPQRGLVESTPLPVNLTLTLHKHLSYEQIAQVYEHQSLSIFPTLSDEWGLVVNEALAAGLPVLGSVYSQAVLDLITPENGWHFRPDDQEAFLRSLDDCLETPAAQLQQMRIAARASVADRTPQWAASHLLAAIDSLSQ